MDLWTTLCAQFAPEQSVQHKSTVEFFDVDLLNDFWDSLPWELPSMSEPDSPPTQEQLTPLVSTSSLLANTPLSPEAQEWLLDHQYAVLAVVVTCLCLFISLLFAYPPIHSRLPHTLALFHDRTGGRLLSLLCPTRSPLKKKVVIIKPKLPKRPPRPPPLSPAKPVEPRKEPIVHVVRTALCVCM